MRPILVTGANKGIGLALVRAILAQHDDTFVFLGSRDEARGRAAAAALIEGAPAWRARLEVVALDVADGTSVAAARDRVAATLGAEPLVGIVNNAGLGTAAGASLREVLEVNVFGIRRVCDAFMPLLPPAGGRVVDVTSASGPTFVAGCSPERQRFFLDRAMTWERLSAFLHECVAHADDRAWLAAEGLGEASAYGLSKAAANTLTMLLAREHPEHAVNACTPGFIETDMTRHYAESAGKPPAELGMKPPEAGTVAPMHLLFGQLDGNGRYYGSDARRSPLDRYREPGSPAFEGD